MNKFLKFVGAFFICVFALTLASCGETKEPTTNEPTQVVPTEKPTPTPTEPSVPTEKPTPTPTEPTIPTENPTPTPEVEEIDYSVVVKDIAGKPLSEFYVTFYLGKDIVAEGFTNSAGTFAKNLEANIYDVLVEGREGYYLNTEMYKTDLIGTPIEVTCEIESLVGKLAPADNFYELGDVMYDFTVSNTEGKELKLYDLLED